MSRALVATLFVAVALAPATTLGQEADAEVKATATEGGVGDRFAERGGQPGDGLEQDGRLSLRDVYSFDNQTPFDVRILFFDADYRAKRLARFGDAELNFRLDSRFLFDLTQDEELQTSEFTEASRKRNERRFGETQTFYDIRLLYAELAKVGNFDLALGRQWFYEAGGAWVDGVSSRFRFTKDWQWSVFGGLGPNPAHYTFDAARQTAGSFLAYETRRFQFSAAYTAQLADSELDRHYAFSRAHWAVPVEATRSLFLSYYASLDLQGDSPTLTTFFTNASWWLNDTLNFSAHYARWANTALGNPDVQRVSPEDNQRELLGNVINQGPYDQIRLSAGQRFGRFFTYQQLDYRRRDLIDKKTATYYRGGIRSFDLFGTRLYANTALTVRNNFASDSFEYLIEGGYRFFDRFDLDAAFIYQSGRSLVIDQSQDVILANISGTLDITRNFYMTLDYELNTETNIAQEEEETSGDLVVHTVFSRVSYRF